MVLWWRAAVGGGERGGGATELVGGPVPREKEEGISRIPEPTLARAEVLRKGVPRDGRRSGAAAMVNGGAREPGGLLAVVAWDVKLECDARVPFIGQVRRWRWEQGSGGVNGSAVLGSPASYAHRATACAARRDVTRRGSGDRRRRRCSGVNGGLQAAWGTGVQGVAWPVRARASAARRPWRVRVVGPVRAHRS